MAPHQRAKSSSGKQEGGRGGEGSGVEFGVKTSGFWVLSFGFSVWSLEFRDQASSIRV